MNTLYMLFVYEFCQQKRYGPCMAVILKLFCAMDRSFNKVLYVAHI